MSIFTSFLIMFPITTYLGVIFLRITAWCFVYRDTSHIFGGAGSTFAITTGLIVAVAAIIYFIIRPFETVVRKIRNEGYVPTYEDKKICLSSYRKFIIAVIVGNVIGFIIGQSTSTIVESILGINPINPPLFGICLAQSIGVGANCALIIICGINELLGKYRIMLDIKSTKGFENFTNASIRAYLIMTLVDAVYLTAIDMIAVPTGLLDQGSLQGAAALSVYLGDVAKAYILNGIFCVIPFAIVLTGLKKRIDSTRAVIEDISNKGDLTTRIKISLLDDFGLMIGSINELMDNLSDMLIKIKSGTDSVNNSAQELSSISEIAGDAIVKVNGAFENISTEVLSQNTAIKKASDNANNLVDGVNVVIKNVGDQTEALRKNSDSIMKMADNISNVANLAQQADMLAKSLTQTSEQGKEALAASVEVIYTIEKSAEDIQNVIRQIQKIASQTNLLSMNASIEAAHAGASGAGFSVVANEVRSLAGESALSAKNIQTQMKEMLKKVKDGVNTINNAGEAFKNVASQVEKTTMLISTITSETENEKQGAEYTINNITSLLQSIEELKSLTLKQGEYAGELMNAMDYVLESSKKTGQVIDNSNSATKDLKNVLSSVENTVSGNVAVVESMKESVNIFKI